MSWALFYWVWRLEAPLFIGIPPAGALNRCRLYVPARALWGAVTAELSRLESGGTFPDYKKMGGDIGNRCRFSYMYPAEKINGTYTAWLPVFEKDQGLTWCRQGGGERPDREFRRCLLHARPGTAITSETDSAAEGTLHETECLNPYWYDSYGRKETYRPVFFAGYVFLRDEETRSRLSHMTVLFLGGDTRYGLGKISRVYWDAATCLFGKTVRLERKAPEVKSRLLLGHTHEKMLKKFTIQGQKELFGGWFEGNLSQMILAWLPGSRCEDGPADVSWMIDEYGMWKETSKE